jgi:hypothetical protein
MTAFRVKLRIKSFHRLSPEWALYVVTGRTVFAGAEK